MYCRKHLKSCTEALEVDANTLSKKNNKKPKCNYWYTKVLQKIFTLNTLKSHTHW